MHYVFRSDSLYDSVYTLTMRLCFGLRVCICVDMVLVESSTLVEGSISTSMNGAFVITLNTSGVSVLLDNMEVAIRKLSLDTWTKVQKNIHLTFHCYCKEKNIIS